MHVYRIKMKSVGNPDFRQFAPVSIPLTVTATHLSTIRVAVEKYITTWDLGSGNWPRCPVRRDGKVVGHFSYNRRFWRTGRKKTR